jgi:hypothetical protein
MNANIYDLDTLHKINYYINKPTIKYIQHPLNIHKSNILIEESNNVVKSIDRLHIFPDNIDSISDICSMEWIDKLL